MARPARRKAELRKFIVAHVRAHPTDIAAFAMARFKVSRQWVTRILGELVDEGLLRREGVTKDVRYIPFEQTHRHLFQVGPGLAEHELWNQFALKPLSKLPTHIVEICHYGFTEMVNNVIDHSESEIGGVEVCVSADQVRLCVFDRGVGIFAKIRRALGLGSGREAVFELTKGKLTTDPAHHTGEGVFFTSRVFDQFSILSNDLFFLNNRDIKDWLLEDREQKAPGTNIFMSISPASTHTLEEVFDHYHYATERDDYAFNRTRLVLKLAEHADGPLISRSQAKRVTARLYRFKEVVFDFSGVDSIGPAFADEIFRVFRLAHPEIEIVPINTNEQTGRMVSRALRASREDLSEAPAEPPAKPPSK